MNQYDPLKNKLQNYKLEIDKDKLWKNTFHAIPQRKRRRAVPVLLLAGLVISGWLLHSSSLLPITESRSSQHTSRINNNDHNAQNLQGTSSANEVELKEPGKNTIEVVSSKLSGSEHLTLTKEMGKNTFPENTKSQNENIETGSLASGEKMENNNSLRTERQVKKVSIESQNVEIVESGVFRQPEGSLVLIHQTENDFSNADREFNNPVDYLVKPVSQIPMTAISVVATGSHMPIIRSQKDQFLQSFQMVQGVGFSTVKIHSLTPESDQLASNLEQKMRSLEILSTSATATMSLPGRFSLETGLQMTQLSTVIDQRWETSERIQQEGVTTIIIDENGVPQPIRGNTDGTRTTHYHAKRFTEHKQVDLVLALHKEIWYAQRLSLNTFVRGAYNLSYQAEGTILSNNDELIGFSKDENPFKRNSLFTMGGGIQMNYLLNPHLKLTSNLTFDQFRYQFKDSTLPVRFRHSGLSFGLGLGYVL